MIIREKYQLINLSFKKVLIFHLGIDAGFFSELSYMIPMILYCLENQIQFQLYSKDANFGYEKGWDDYFMPFCPEVNSKFHHKFNRHITNTSWCSIFRELFQERRIGKLKWKIKSNFYYVVAKVFHVFLCKDKYNYLTQDLFKEAVLIKDRYDIDSLNIHGDYVEAYNRIFDIIWNFNESTEKDISELIHMIQLPEKYISCQIRGGDKITEYELLPIDLYISKIKSLSSLKDVFVLTDDYRNMLKLRKKEPTFRWITLCQEEEQGYNNRSFRFVNSIHKRQSMLRLFASMRVLELSNLFIGSITPAPSCVMGIRKFPNAQWIDCSPSDFYKSLSFSIKKRSELRREFLNRSKLENII